MLTWYGDRMLDATSSVMFTAAFGVAKQLIGPLAKERDFLRFVLMERPPAGEAKAQLTADRDLIIPTAPCSATCTPCKAARRWPRARSPSST